jgi:hypothetical protein
MRQEVTGEAVRKFDHKDYFCCHTCEGEFERNTQAARKSLMKEKHITY